MLLYLDTISDLSKIIIYSDHFEELKRKEWPAGRNQTDELLVEIDALIQEQKNEVDGIFVNTNPGSYTSMRIGLTVANSLGLALNIQPTGVSSPAKVKFQGRQNFKSPLLAVHKSEPFITKKER